MLGRYLRLRSDARFLPLTRRIKEIGINQGNCLLMLLLAHAEEVRMVLKGEFSAHFLVSSDSTAAFLLLAQTAKIFGCIALD